MLLSAYLPVRYKYRTTALQKNIQKNQKNLSVIAKVKKQLVFPFSLEEVKMFLATEEFTEGDTVRGFGKGWSVPTSIRPCLHDVHDTPVALRVAPQIIRIATHQHACHRINPYVKLHFRHRATFKQL